MTGRVAALCIVAIAVSGCRAPVPDAYLMASGHPANPHAAPGKPLQPSGALQPEFVTVRPKLEQSPAPASPAAGHRHQH